MRITQRKVFDLSEVNEADVERIVDWYNACFEREVLMDDHDHAIARMLKDALRG